MFINIDSQSESTQLWRAWTFKSADDINAVHAFIKLLSIGVDTNLVIVIVIL